MKPRSVTVRASRRTRRIRMSCTARSRAASRRRTVIAGFPNSRRVRGGLLLVTLAAGVISAAAIASTSPAGLLASIMAAARAEQSVHYVSSGNYGPAEITFVGDAGVSQGIQRITFREGAQTGHVTLLVSANTAYVRGDAFTLVNYMRFMPGAAAKYAGRWILIPHTAAGYPTDAAGVRLSSTMAELKVAGHPSTVARTQIDGQRLFGVRGTRTAC